jgi:hypothetical protein
MSERLTENEIIRRLKEQRKEIIQHPKLTNLVTLYDYCIDLHESNWLREHGIIEKSELPDLKNIIDQVGMEHKRNNEATLLLEESNCNECQNKDAEKILYINRNTLGMITLDD